MRHVFFAFSNWDFSLLMGGIYFMFAALISLRGRPDIYELIVAVFGASLIDYTISTVQDLVFGGRARRGLRRRPHLRRAIRDCVQQPEFCLERRIVGGLEVVLPGRRRNGTGPLPGWQHSLFGLNMLITCLLFRMNRNDRLDLVRCMACSDVLCRAEFQDHLVRLNTWPDLDAVAVPHEA